MSLDTHISPEVEELHSPGSGDCDARRRESHNRKGRSVQATSPVVDNGRRDASTAGGLAIAEDAAPRIILPSGENWQPDSSGAFCSAVELGQEQRHSLAGFGRGTPSWCGEVQCGDSANMFGRVGNDLFLRYLLPGGVSYGGVPDSPGCHYHAPVSPQDNLAALSRLKALLGEHGPVLDAVLASLAEFVLQGTTLKGESLSGEASVEVVPSPARERLRVSTGAPHQSAHAEVLESLLESADKELAIAHARISELESQVLDLAGENDDLVGWNSRLASAYDQLSVVAAGGHVHGVSGEEDLPVRVSSLREALDEAKKLPFVVVHPEAPVDIEQLDSTLTASAWANMLWRGLRALNAYAAGDHRVAGGFYEWCRDSGSPWSWTATDKKLAMRESQGVMANSRLRNLRRLPVDEAVDESGFIEMQSHLKIAQGGSTLIPRVYFYDDTAGVTGKVHVGFVGPHARMPNMSTS